MMWSGTTGGRRWALLWLTRIRSSMPLRTARGGSGHHGLPGRAGEPVLKRANHYYGDYARESPGRLSPRPGLTTQALMMD